MGKARPSASFGRAVRDEWLLEGDMVHLNHAAFGATPKIVLEAAEDWRRRMEAAPTRFMEDELPTALRSAAVQLAEFLGGKGDDLVFVHNATTGINAVLRSLVFMPGDEVVTTSHMYRSTRRTLEFVCERAGARLVAVDLSFPVRSAREIVAAITRALTPRTRLLVIDHVTSPTAIVMPVEQLTALARERDIPVLVDGAHAPGNLPLDLDALGARGVHWYVGNCHKWLSAPKGCGFLWTHPDHKRLIRPTAIGNQFGKSYTAAFDWPGTKDFSAWLAVVAALEFQNRFGAEEIRDYCHGLAHWAAAMLAEDWNGVAGTPPALTSAMATVGISGQATEAAAETLHRRLRSEYQIEVPVIAFAGRLWVRISAFLYNEAEDYQALRRAVSTLTA